MPEKRPVSFRFLSDSKIFEFLIAIVWFSIFMNFWVGCSGAGPQRPVKGFEDSGIKRVLVLPFENVTRIYGENVSFRNAISGKVFITGSVGANAEVLLTDLLVGRIADVDSYQLIPPEQAEGVISRQDENNIQDARSKVMQLGRRLGADVVLVGFVLRFKERIGKKYAVDSPASVAFDLNMVDARSGELIWDGHFDETQRALSENLLLIGKFFKRGGAWVTAQQMAVEGIDDLIPKMPVPQR